MIVLTKQGAFDADLMNAINANFAEAVALASGSALTTTNIGTVPGSTVTAVERGNATQHTTTLTLTALALSLSQAHVGGGAKIYTFPTGNITITAASASIALTTTSAILTTLNGGKTLSGGVGSVQTTTQDSGTLATTQQDVVNAFAPVSSTVINVAAATATGVLSTGTPRYNGSVTPQALYLNIGIPTPTDIDADATVTVSGTVTMSWVFNGVVPQ